MMTMRVFLLYDGNKDDVTIMRDDIRQWWSDEGIFVLREREKYPGDRRFRYLETGPKTAGRRIFA